MGEAAEDMLDGTCCEQCGEFMDDIFNGAQAPGYPRTCVGCGGAGDDTSDEPLDHPVEPARTDAQRETRRQKNIRKRRNRKLRKAAASEAAQ